MVSIAHVFLFLWRFLGRCFFISEVRYYSILSAVLLKNSHPGLLLVCLKLSLTSFLARWEQRCWEKHTLNAGRVSFLLPLGSLCLVSWEFNQSVALLFFDRCDRRKIPLVTDLEYDSFISEHVPRTQLLVVSVTSSLWVANVTSVFQIKPPPIACLLDYTPTTYVFLLFERSP